MAVDGEALQIKDQYILGEIAQGAQDFAHLVGSSSLSEQRVDQGHLESVLTYPFVQSNLD